MLEFAASLVFSLWFIRRGRFIWLKTVEWRPIANIDKIACCSNSGTLLSQKFIDRVQFEKTIHKSGMPIEDAKKATSKLFGSEILVDYANAMKVLPSISATVAFELALF